MDTKFLNSPAIPPLNAHPAELARFNQLAARWWDETSEFKPMHRITTASPNAFTFADFPASATCSRCKEKTSPKWLRKKFIHEYVGMGRRVRRLWI